MNLNFEVEVEVKGCQHQNKKCSILHALISKILIESKNLLNLNILCSPDTSSSVANTLEFKKMLRIVKSKNAPEVAMFVDSASGASLCQK